MELGLGVSLGNAGLSEGLQAIRGIRPLNLQNLHPSQWRFLPREPLALQGAACGLQSWFVCSALLFFPPIELSHASVACSQVEISSVEVGSQPPGGF